MKPDKTRAAGVTPPPIGKGPSNHLAELCLSFINETVHLDYLSSLDTGRTQATGNGVGVSTYEN